MQFESLAEFLYMGGHGKFVWAVYIMGIAVLLYNVIRPKMMQRQLVAQHLQAQKREQRREQQDGQVEQQ